MCYYIKQSLTVNNKKETYPYYQRFFSNLKGRILDVGCAIGNFVALDPENIIGVDMDKEAILKTNERGLSCILMDIEMGTCIKSGCLNGIHASQIIEHLDRPLNIMKEFYRILKPGGLLVLAAPDAKKIKHVFWDDYTHKRPYSKKSLECIAHDAGFVKIKTIYEPKNIHGFGWLVRKNILSAKTIILIQNFLLSIGIRHNSIYLTAIKPASD
jgi:SAM-dependent methyltransferase